jgi:hypothetical protein
MTCTSPDPDRAPDGVGALEDLRVRLEQTLALFQEVDRLTAEVGRLTHPRRFIVLRLLQARRAQRLDDQASACLAQLAQLHGLTYTPPIRRDYAIGAHPLLWWCLQQIGGVVNACYLVSGVSAGDWWFAVLSASGIVLCANWQVPAWGGGGPGKW